MKYVSVFDAVGLTLCHDITEIIPGSHKGAAFKRGHIVRAEDIEQLLRLGKEHLYVWQEQSGMVHEDDAARRIAAAIAGPGVAFGLPQEGRVNLSAACNGLLCIDTDLLERVNSIPHVTVATLHSMQGVVRERTLAGVRVIPLTVPESTVFAVEECCKDHTLVSVKPFREHRVGIVTTGSEVYQGRIKDSFGLVLEEKFRLYAIPVIFHTLVPDDVLQTAGAIEEAIARGATFVAVTGGMSVDPDDRTPGAIRKAASDVVCYGAPVFPGAMFMLAYKDHVPLLGLPGCVMYHKASIFDVLLPRLLAGERITHRDIVRLAHGGLCENCPECRYPACGFCKTGC